MSIIRKLEYDLMIDHVKFTNDFDIKVENLKKKYGAFAHFLSINTYYDKSIIELQLLTCDNPMNLAPLMEDLTLALEATSPFRKK